MAVGIIADMQRVVTLPMMGQTMEEGVIVQWFKQIGDRVEKGDLLFEVLTDKTNIEVDSTEQGYLRKVLVPLETTVPVGAPIAILTDTADEPIEETIDRRLASPRARTVAAEKGIDLRTVEVSDGGVIRASQVEGLQGAIGSYWRRQTAEAVSRSWREAPHVTLFAEAVMPNETGVLARIAQACGRALAQMPEINVRWSGQGIVPFDEVNVGLAVALDDGLAVASLVEPHRSETIKVESEIKRLAELARQNKLGPNDTKPAAITVSNLGAFGIDGFTPIITPGQTFILGVGARKQRPIVFDGQVVAAFTVPLSLSFDHRAVDGVPAARLLGLIKLGLEEE